MAISLTETAAKEVKRIIEEQQLPKEQTRLRVGVRGGTADGLPLAGPSGEPGLHLALAPLRNGWLLGPLVARIVADGIEGGAPLPDAAALDPLRFG